MQSLVDDNGVEILLHEKEDCLGLELFSSERNESVTASLDEELKQKLIRMLQNSTKY